MIHIRIGSPGGKGFFSIRISLVVVASKVGYGGLQGERFGKARVHLEGDVDLLDRLVVGFRIHKVLGDEDSGFGVLFIDAQSVFGVLQ